MFSVLISAEVSDKRQHFVEPLAQQSIILKSKGVCLNAGSLVISTDRMLEPKLGEYTHVFCYYVHLNQSVFILGVLSSDMNWAGLDRTLGKRAQ
jgi:hypothetical protein